MFHAEKSDQLSGSSLSLYIVLSYVLNILIVAHKYHNKFQLRKERMKITDKKASTADQPTSTDNNIYKSSEEEQNNE